MAFKMRLYHRRSSASRERLLANSSLNVDPLQKLKAKSSHTPRASIDGHASASRPRSLSLYPGLERQNCLPIPTRSRSNSFSGVGSRFAEGPATMTSSQEDYVFRCYTTAMYFILGVTAATLVFFVLYALHRWTQKSYF